MAKSSSPSSALFQSRSRYNVFMVSFAFMVLFCAYNTLQNYATSLFPAGLGNQSLAVLYAACAVSVFAAPGLTNQLGPRLTMFIGAACYVAYMLSLISIIPWVVLLMSTVIGFGGAILWIALGVFITQNSTTSTYGQNTGIFWSIFQLCNVAGNLATYLVFSKLSSTTWLYVGFAVIGTVGTGMLVFLRKPLHQHFTGSSSSDNDESHTFHISQMSTNGSSSSSSTSSSSKHSFNARVSAFCVDVGRAGRLMCTRNMALLMPMYFFSGLELSFWSGEFSQMLSTNVIGLVLTFVGIGEVFGGVMFGRLSDIAGRSVSIGLGAVCYASGLGIACYMRASGWMPAPVIGGAPVVAYVAALLFGLGDSAFNANCYAICAQLYHDGPSSAALIADDEENESNSADEVVNARAGLLTGGGKTQSLLEASDAVQSSSNNNGGNGGGTGAGASVEGGTNSVGAFTVFQLVQNIGSAVGFFYALPLPMHDPAPGTATNGYPTVGSYTQAYIQFAILVVATIMFIAMDRINVAEVKQQEADEKVAEARNQGKR